jgi:hypothetical protein
VKRVLVPLNDFDEREIDASHQSLMDMGNESVRNLSRAEAEREPAFPRPGPAVILEVPEEMSLSWVRRMVAHALTHLKTHAYPGEPITLG